MEAILLNFTFEEFKTYRSGENSIKKPMYSLLARSLPPTTLSLDYFETNPFHPVSSVNVSVCICKIDSFKNLNLVSLSHLKTDNNSLMWSFPGGAVVENLPTNSGDTGPWSGKIPHAVEQLSTCATATEPVL